MPPTAEQIEEIKAHVARLEGENGELSKRLLKITARLIQGVNPDIILREVDPAALSELEGEQ